MNGKNYWTKSDGTRFLYYNKYHNDFKIVQQKYFGTGEGVLSSISAEASADCPNEIPKSSWKYYSNEKWNEWNEEFPLISIWNGKFKSMGK